MMRMGEIGSWVEEEKFVEQGHFQVELPSCCLSMSFFSLAGIESASTPLGVLEKGASERLWAWGT